MKLSEQLNQKIYESHFVRGIKPDSYMVKFRSIFELLQYRLHLQPDDLYIKFFPDAGPGESLTYAQFTDKVYRTANLLKHNGIRPQDRIATVSHNHINTVVQYFAAWCVGATVVPVNVNEDDERIKYILNSSGSKLAFVNAGYLEKVLSFMEEFPALKKIFVHGVNGPVSREGVEVYEYAAEKMSVVFDVPEEVGPETESLIVYTSGTTGHPKGVVLTQYNLMADADGISKWHGLVKGDVMMCVLPIHHVNGTVVTLVTPMYYGGSVVLNQKFHTDRFFTLIAEENVKIVSVVPTLLQFLCHENKESSPTALSFTSNREKIKRDFGHIICGAGPLTYELALKFEDMFGMKIIHGYGLSETTCYSCFLPVGLTDDAHRSWLSDHGFPSIGVEIHPNEMDIHDEKGEPVPEGQRGEIVIRGHNVMKYYDQDPEANERTFEFGWFRSGDEGFCRKDEMGRKFFFITGRIKELIIRGGVNIAPLEIDEVLMSLPEVKAGIAVGFDNDWYGEEIGALVVLKENITEGPEAEAVKRKILDRCFGKLPFYKSPKVVILSDSIPVTSTGKYRRSMVKNLFSDYKKVQFREEKG